MVCYSKPKEDSPVLNINAKAKVKLLIAGFGLLHHNKISNFLISRKYNAQKFYLSGPVTQ